MSRNRSLLMMRSTAWPVFGLLLLAGCATSATSWKLPGWGKSTAAPEQRVAEQATPSSTNAAAEPANPFRPAGDSQVITASAEGVLPGNVRPAGGHSEISRFDPATLMLIETEFKDATAEERKQWFQELKQIPPELVPQVLRMRRLAQQANSQPHDSGATGEPAVAATSSAQRPGQPQQPGRTGSENHLGGLAPWEEQILRDNLTHSTAKFSGQNRGELSASEIQMIRSEQTANDRSQQNLTGSSLQVNQPATLTAAQNDNRSGAPAENDPSSQISARAEYQQALERLIALSEQQVAQLKRGDLEEEKLHYASQHAYLRMLYLMAERQERALEAIPQLPPSEQEFWQQMFWAMSSYFDSTGIPNPADRATHTVSQLSEANLRLRERANLELRNLTFCKKIDGFGSYERFDRDEFRPGQAVLVYAEMRNFLSEPTSDGQYKTILKSTIEIHRAGSQSGLVSRQDFSPTEDYCRNRRHDYFHSYLINLPERVTVGPHILKLIVEDQLNRKIASYTINFTVN